MMILSLDDLSIPVPETRRTVNDFLLQQNSVGQFQMVTPVDGTTRQMALSQSVGSVQQVLGDYNADGRTDVLLKNVAANTNGGQDMIVFAPLEDGATPMAVTNIDATRQAFIRDVAGWVENPDHFDSGLYWVTYTGYFKVAYFNCGGTTYASLQDNPNNAVCFAGCQYLGWNWAQGSVSVQYFDPTGFSTEALDLLANVAPYINADDTFSIPADAAQSIRVQAGQVLGVPVFGQTTVDVPAGDWEGDWEFTRWLTRINPWAILSTLTMILSGDTPQKMVFYRVAGEAETMKVLGRQQWSLDNPSGWGEIQFWTHIVDARNFMKKSRDFLHETQELAILVAIVRQSTYDACVTLNLSDGNKYPAKSCGAAQLPALNFDAKQFKILATERSPRVPPP
ncbi:hypothetical protein ACFPN2_09960 [Steroidobacter flavus]|uniref:VCBS repeat-containing protein n=1 Tax=Steroidobacter flavus TaxID=1842136 RepID=A0ABV8SRU1_9GAMM